MHTIYAVCLALIVSVLAKTQINSSATLHLSSIASEQVYTALHHPNFSAHQVRIKKSSFCDPTVKYGGVWNPASLTTLLDYGEP